MKSSKISEFLYMLRSDKVSAHSYGDVYDTIFSNISINKLLEMGIAYGSSINAFGLFLDQSEVYGIDINKKLIDTCRIMSNNINLIHYNVTDPSIIDIFSDIKFEVIIDDASHRPDFQMKTFDIYKRFLSDDGIYIIEDVNEKMLLEVEFIKKFINIDLRGKRGRFDDYLLIYTKNKNLLHLL
jgi:cephalosporin hydroxylase